MSPAKIRVALVPLAFLVPLHAQSAFGPVQKSIGRPGNVLLIIMDDVGPDMLNVYGTGTDVPPTPNIDALAAGGLLFRRAYSNPAGSVTMATVETGRTAELTGIGSTIYDYAGGTGLALTEITLPEMLALGTVGYETAMFGKWFLGKSESVGGDLAPNAQGYGHYAGVLEQLYIGGYDYFEYPWVVNGVSTLTTGYATSQTVDEALAWIDQQTGPWFCNIAFHCAHTPYHEPPAGLHTQVLPTTLDPHGNLRPWYKAMVEALDAEIGRLVNTLDPAVREQTTIFLLADNGTPNGTVAPPLIPGHGKFTVYEGGINIPMIVSGFRVKDPGREVNALVQTTDLFATIADLARVDLADALPGTVLESISFYPHLIDPVAPALRQVVFAELFHPDGVGLAAFNTQEYAARNERFKLIQRQIVAGEPLHEEFYDLSTDLYEQNDLLLSSDPGPEAAAAYLELSAFLEAQLALP
jgi:arylsulfatase A-like enzyme